MHEHHDHLKSNGSAGDDVLISTRGGVNAFDGNDILHLIAQQGRSQIHSYAADGNDYTFLMFAEITSFSHGHHARGGDGSDVFDFVGVDRVSATIAGRIEDFDHSRDELRIEGELIDLDDLPENVTLVAFNGHIEQPGADPQQWLLIETSAGGHVFYALEGARIDMSAQGQEAHFLLDDIDFNALPEIAFVDPMNYVPAGLVPDGGIIIDDVDRTPEDVMDVIRGTLEGDLIAGGLNEDIIRTGDGNDRVWGGSGDDKIWGGNGEDYIEGNPGHDYLHGGKANDIIFGGSGNDTIFGDGHHDFIWGGEGDDVIKGGWGHDAIFGGPGNDKLFGNAGFDELHGGDGNDTIWGGGGDDFINGGAGRDRIYGGDGSDTFVFDEFERGFDVVFDFEPSIDKLLFAGAVEDHDDIQLFRYRHQGETSTLLRFKNDDGDIDRDLGGLVLSGVTMDQLSLDDFFF